LGRLFYCEGQGKRLRIEPVFSLSLLLAIKTHNSIFLEVGREYSVNEIAAF
jgi:hypothetical protein